MHDMAAKKTRRIIEDLDFNDVGAPCAVPSTMTSFQHTDDPKFPVYIGLTEFVTHHGQHVDGLVPRKDVRRLIKWLTKVLEAS